MLLSPFTLLTLTNFFFFYFDHFLWTLMRAWKANETKIWRCHGRSKSLEEAEWSLIISLLLLHSNALNKIKASRAYLVIYFLDMQPTVKIISKETILPLFSLSKFKLHNFWVSFQTTSSLAGKARYWLAWSKVWVVSMCSTDTQ